jgi:CDP-glycerol glycerophosphotransferase
LFIKIHDDYVVFINPKGKFLDNSKYLFLKLRKIKQSFWLVSTKKDYNYLKSKGINVIYLYSFKGILIFFKCSTIVMTDVRGWEIATRLFIRNKSIIQLWHGIGFKKIGKLKSTDFDSTNLIDLISKCLLHPITPSVFAVTSEFYRDEVFSPAYPEIPFDHFIITGYPRNDVLNKKIEGEDIWTDKKILNNIASIKSKFDKIILYAPTFRDKGNNPLTDGAIDFKEINKNAKRMNHLWIMKFHGMPVVESNYEIDGEFSNILFYDIDKDVYPLLRDADLLVTDYSSIYMDFLLLDRPIVFYPYDLERYEKKDRGFSHPYDTMTPGKKVFRLADLLEFISKEAWNDDFKDERRRVRNFAFKYQDFESADRLLKYFEKN